jgi:GAF domain-containing protein
MTLPSEGPPVRLEQAIVDLRQELAECRAERDEALARETATAEVLGVINASPANLTPVFEAMIERATRLCEADLGTLWTFDGDCLHPAVWRGQDLWIARERVQPPPQSPLGRIIAGESVVHVIDAAADPGYQSNDDLRARTAASGTRSTLVVALRKNGTLLGAITTGRKRVQPYSDKHIALLQNFAAQAVIAMENTRLINETREALEQQTATAEVLGAINASPGDLAPVFDAMLEKAHSLCGAPFGTLLTYDGEHFQAVATRGLPEALAQRLQQGGHGANNPISRALLDGAPFVQIPDLGQIDDPLTRAGAAVGIRTMLSVPLRKDRALLGWISATRREVRPFTDKQIALLQNFAAQAVIAMENARLITETREALEQQTATAEVLGVINSSPGNLAPVFDAMLEKALQLVNAAYGRLLTFDGERFSPAADRGDARLAYLASAAPFRPTPSSILNRFIQGENVIQIADLLKDDNYRTNPRFREFVDIAGYRSVLDVALRKENALFGFIAVFRKETGLFSDKQIALLQNFAAQAVIAMENARLLGELRQRTEEVAELNRGLEARVAAQAEELGRGRAAEALPRAAIGGAHRVAGRRKNPRKPSPRDRRGVLRPTRLHRLHRDRRARGGPRFPAAIPWCAGAARRPVRRHARPVFRRWHHGVLQRPGADSRPG